MKINFTVEAQADLDSTIIFYQNINLETRNSFVKTIEKSLSLMSNFPNMAANKSINNKIFKCYVLNKFPIVIFYKMEKENILIVRILHMHRDMGILF